MSKTIYDLLDGTIRHPMQWKNSKVTPVDAACASLLQGIELEIENVPHWDELEVSGMTSKEDGSLRNNGREFITEPMSISCTNYVLTKFFERAKLTDNNYSERCSVHVHCNVLDLTVDELSTVCLLYQLFEQLLYAYAGAERDKNIFCVPWNQTQLSYRTVDKLLEHGVTGVRSWMKYTGLNLATIFNIGTIEFRQMPGTHDKERIINWCNILGCLFAYAKSHKLEDVKDTIIKLNTSSAYAQILGDVFQQWTPHVQIPGYEYHLEEGSLNTKFCLMKQPVPKFSKAVLRQELHGEDPEPFAWNTTQAPTVVTAATQEAHARLMAEIERMRMLDTGLGLDRRAEINLETEEWLAWNDEGDNP